MPLFGNFITSKHYLRVKPNAALRCERRLAILERSESAKRCESLLNALLYQFLLSRGAIT